MRLTPKIHSLQALRAIAAWLVITDHAILELTHNSPANPASNLAWSLGEAGVYVFFVLSGFIMVHISWDAFSQPGAPMQFLRRRLVRIVPLYWGATLLALAYHRVSATHGAHAGLRELTYSLAFIPYPGDDNSWRPILPGGWTLNYEMLFYGVFTLGLLLPRPRGLAVVASSLALFVGVGFFLPAGSLSVLASPIIFWFLLGMGLALQWHRHNFSEPAWLARPARFLEPLGDASYSTYLSHGFVLTLLLRLWQRTAGEPGIWIIPVSLVVTTLIGWIVHVSVEKPVLQRVNNWLRPRGRPAAALGVAGVGR